MNRKQSLQTELPFSLWYNPVEFLSLVAPTWARRIEFVHSTSSHGFIFFFLDEEEGGGEVEGGGEDGNRAIARVENFNDRWSIIVEKTAWAFFGNRKLLRHS